MMITDPKKLNEMRELLSILCTHFDMPPIHLKMRYMGRSGGYYSAMRREIVVPNSWPDKNTRYVVLHEFAHHLHRCEESADRQRTGYINKRNKPHGTQFCECLDRVIMAWGESFGPNDMTEYKMVLKYIVDRGKSYGKRLVQPAECQFKRRKRRTTIIKKKKQGLDI